MSDIGRLNISFLRENVTETSLTIRVILSGVDLMKFENTRLVDINEFMYGSVCGVQYRFLI